MNRRTSSEQSPCHTAGTQEGENPSTLSLLSDPPTALLEDAGEEQLFELEATSSKVNTFLNPD
jgi:hypothetical protein